MRKLQINLLFSLLLVLSGFRATVIADCIYDKSLNGETIAIGAMLTWSTISETDNSLFVIEKSLNGLTFEGIGTLMGAGNSQGAKKYSFLDIKAGAGKLYYRLKQVDFDGSYQYSAVLDLNKTGENNFIVSDMSSETTSKTFDLEIEALTNTQMKYQLRDTKGNIIKENALPLLAGMNPISIDLADQNAGIYKIVLISGNEEETLMVRRVLDETERAANVATNKKPETKKN